MHYFGSGMLDGYLISSTLSMTVKMLKTMNGPLVANDTNVVVSFLESDCSNGSSASHLFGQYIAKPGTLVVRWEVTFYVLATLQLTSR